MKITVITIAYNSAGTITDTLDSIARQSHVDIEHIVIDGASKDGTVEMVKNHTSSKTCLISEPDNGIYEAMNKGLSRASGEIIGFLNSDDFYADDAVLEKVANSFQDPEIEACYGDLLYVTQDNKRVVRYWKSKLFAKGDFAKAWCPAHPTFYVRKTAIERLGLFDLSYKLGADIELMMRYLECGLVRSIYIPHVLVRMRIGGVTNKNWRNIYMQNKEILSALRKNKVPFSSLKFLIYKIAARFWQFAAGRLMGNT